MQNLQRFELIDLFNRFDSKGRTMPTPYLAETFVVGGGGLLTLVVFVLIICLIIYVVRRM